MRPPARSQPAALLAVLLLATATAGAPAATAADGGDGADGAGPDATSADGLAHATATLLDDLARAARALDASNASAARDALASARDRFEADVAPAAGSADPDPTRAALEALNASAGDGDATAFRTAVVDVEAELWRLAAANVETDDMDDAAGPDGSPGDDAAADAWTEVARVLVAGPERSLPGGDAAPGAVLDSALALRLMEEVSAAGAAALHDGPPDPAPHVRRAEALWPVLRPRANATLPAGAFASLDEAMTDLPARVAALSPEDASGLDDARGPLTVLAYRRAAAPLDIVAAGLEGGLFAAHRAFSAGSPRAGPLFDAAVRDYYRHRTFLFREGEAGVDATDAAVEALVRGVELGIEPSIEEAVSDLVQALRETALLDHGLVVKVEQVVLLPGAAGAVRVALFHAPLEGVAAYEVTLAYDPAVAAVRDVRPGGRLAEGFQATRDEEAATVTLRGGADPAFVGAALLATLDVEAVGAPGDRTGVAVRDASFTAGDGDAARVLRVRDGSVVVGGAAAGDDLDRTEGVGGGTGPALPGPGGAGTAAALALAAVVWALLPRRGTAGEPGPDVSRFSGRGPGRRP